jgi:hypothetical protein
MRSISAKSGNLKAQNAKKRSASKNASFSMG